MFACCAINGRLFVREIHVHSVHVRMLGTLQHTAAAAAATEHQETQRVTPCAAPPRLLKSSGRAVPQQPRLHVSQRWMLRLALALAEGGQRELAGARATRAAHSGCQPATPPACAPAVAAAAAPSRGDDGAPPACAREIKTTPTWGWEQRAAGGRTMAFQASSSQHPQQVLQKLTIGADRMACCIPHMAHARTEKKQQQLEGIAGSLLEWWYPASVALERYLLHCKFSVLLTWCSSLAVLLVLQHQCNHNRY